MGRVEISPLILKKPHGDIIGVLGHAFNVEAELKFNETSQITFNYPKRVNGEKTPFYDDLAGDKLIQIDPLGVFVVQDPNEQIEAQRKVKSVTAYSREYELVAKKVIFSDGTYNLWNPADQDNTLLGMIFNSIRGWTVGAVSASLIGRYRTFSETDTNVLDFLLGTVQEKYGCVFVFDTYNCVVNVIDADEDLGVAPIYLSHQNLLKDVSLTEQSSGIVTRLYVQGADGVDIRNVNPIGENYIYNLDYYIANGDIPADIAKRWVEWQDTIVTNQPSFTALVALRNSYLSWVVEAQASLFDLQGQLASIENENSVYLAAQMRVQKNGTEWNSFQSKIDALASKRLTLEADISAQEALINSVKSNYIQCNADIASISNALKIDSFFTSKELDVLSRYFKEDSFSDSTFAVYDIDASDGGSLTTAQSVKIEFSSVTWQDIQHTSSHRIGVITGGDVSITGDNYSLQAAVVDATLDHTGTDVICSIRLGNGAVNGDKFLSANLTCVCTSNYSDSTLLGGMSLRTEVVSTTDQSASFTLYYYSGNASINATNGSIYFTKNSTDYQRYSVERDLYDYATKCLKDLSCPTYEFEIKSGNLIFDQKFAPFKDAIQLGCGIHLQLDDDLEVTPMLLEIHLSFENPDSFSLIFSNEFKRPDQVNTLKDILADATSMSRNVDMSKYSNYENRNTTTWVKNLLQNGYDAALAQIMAGADNLVTIDKMGITIDSANGIDKIMLNNGMIAMLNKNTNTVQMALGHFLNPATGTDFVGVLADVIGGTLLAGQNLVIECPDPNGGVMQFKVDSSGVIINNGRMYMKNSKGAMGWDANYGFFAGNTALFNAASTGYVSPACVDANGNLILDSNGFPQNVNVWIGIDGKAYFRGSIYAESGYFNGTVRASEFLDAAGNSMLSSGKIKSEYLDVRGLNVNDNFIVDQDGHVTINGGSISLSAIDGADSLSDLTDSVDAIQDTISDWSYTYNGTTYIDGTRLMTGTVTASSLQGGEVEILDSYGDLAASLEMNTTSTYGLSINSVGGMRLLSDGSLYMQSDGACMRFESGTAATDYLSTVALLSCDCFHPLGTASNLGHTDLGLWNALYACSGTIITSDRNLKHDIENLPQKYVDMLDLLTPKRFKLNSGTSDRYHVGFIAQEVEAAMSATGITDQEFAGWCKDKDTDGNDVYMLRYDEFIGLLHEKIRRLESKIEALESNLTDTQEVL